MTATPSYNVKLKNLKQKLFYGTDYWRCGKHNEYKKVHKNLKLKKKKNLHENGIFRIRFQI